MKIEMLQRFTRILFSFVQIFTCLHLQKNHKNHKKIIPIIVKVNFSLIKLMKSFLFLFFLWIYIYYIVGCTISLGPIPLLESHKFAYHRNEISKNGDLSNTLYFISLTKNDKITHIALLTHLHTGDIKLWPKK